LKCYRKRELSISKQLIAMSDDEAPVSD
jgi:hypothetical protein